MYVCVRQVVNVFEYMLAWTGHKRVLRQRLRAATTWDQWKAAATEMDQHLGFEEWKGVREQSG